MNIYSVLGVLFVIGTIIMTVGLTYMGYLHWKEERLTPPPPRPTARKLPEDPRLPVAANDTREIRKAS